MEELEIKLTAQQVARLSENEARLQIANDCMSEVMAAYSRIADREQHRFDTLMETICDVHGNQLPKPYEYSFDPNLATLKIRQKSEVVSSDMPLPPTPPSNTIINGVMHDFKVD